MAKFIIKTKEGVQDKQVWNFLLSKDVDITPVRAGVTKANVPAKVVAKLSELADLEADNGD